jgi:hypothetical protein
VRAAHLRPRHAPNSMHMPACAFGACICRRGHLERRCGAACIRAARADVHVDARQAEIPCTSTSARASAMSKWRPGWHRIRCTRLPSRSTWLTSHLVQGPPGSRATWLKGHLAAIAQHLAQGRHGSRRLSGRWHSLRDLSPMHACCLHLARMASRGLPCPYPTEHLLLRCRWQSLLRCCCVIDEPSLNSAHMSLTVHRVTLPVLTVPLPVRRVQHTSRRVPHASRTWLPV